MEEFDVPTALKRPRGIVHLPVIISSTGLRRDVSLRRHGSAGEGLRNCKCEGIFARRVSGN